MIEHRWDVFGVEIKLCEGANLGQRLDVSLQICGLDQAGFCRYDEDLDFTEQQSPVECQVFERSKVVFPPKAQSVSRQRCFGGNILGEEHEHAGETLTDARVYTRCQRELVV